MELMVALTIVVAATAVILNLRRVAAKSPFSVSRLGYIDSQAAYQVLLLCVAALVLLALHFVNAANLSDLLAPGDISAPAAGVFWLGISNGESWLRLGASLSLVITLATSIFAYLQFRKSGGGLKRLAPYVPWIVLFSLSNSFSEEVVYRLGAIVPLLGSVDPALILLVSAVAFGAPHLRGMPSGTVGAVMAGLLGWVLAKSVVETNGIFWAWSIHFLQDLVIFSALVLAATNKSLGRSRRADQRLAS